MCISDEDLSDERVEEEMNRMKKELNQYSLQPRQANTALAVVDKGNLLLSFRIFLFVYRFLDRNVVAAIII